MLIIEKETGSVIGVKTVLVAMSLQKKKKTIKNSIL